MKPTTVAHKTCHSKLKMPPSTQNLVKSADRTIRLFEFFAFVKRSATASEIQAALEIPQSSTSLLLHSLLSLGYLEFLPRGRMYRPTQRVKSLGDWLAPDSSLNQLLARLDEMRKRTRETVLLARRDGLHVHYMRILLSDNEIQYYMPEGAKRPLSTTVSGRALLSALDDREIRQIVRRHNADSKKAAQLDIDILFSAIRKIRRTGISETDNKLGGREDYFAIAGLVPAQISMEPTCLSVAGPRDRIMKRREAIIATLREWLST